MNSLFLFTIGALVLLMGHRYFARFLEATVLRPLDVRRDSDRNEGIDIRTVGVSSGILPVFGIALALTWGWTPIYVWVLVGGTVIAVLLNTSMRWLASLTPGRHGLDSLEPVCGSGLQTVTRIILLTLLAIWTPILVVALTTIVTRYPSTLIVVGIQFLIALPISRWHYRTSDNKAVIDTEDPVSRIITVFIAGVTAFLIGVAFSPYAIDALSADIFTERSLVIFVALVIAMMVTLSSRNNEPSFSKQAFTATFTTFVSIGLWLFLIVFLLLLLLERPDVAYLAYFRHPDWPAALPLVLACASFGIIPLTAWLVMPSASSEAMQTTSRRPFANTAEGLIALTVVIVWLAGPAIAPDVSVAVTDWNKGIEFAPVIDYLITIIAESGGNLPFEPSYLVTVVASVFAGLTWIALSVVTTTLKRESAKVLPTELVRFPVLEGLLFIDSGGFAIIILVIGALPVAIWFAGGALAILMCGILLTVCSFAAQRLNTSHKTLLASGAALLLMFWWLGIERLINAILDLNAVGIASYLAVIVLGVLASIGVVVNFRR